MHSQRGNSSVGRARPCQGRGREFKSRFPLHKDDSKGHPFFCCMQGLCSVPERWHERSSILVQAGSGGEAGSRFRHQEPSHNRSSTGIRLIFDRSLARHLLPQPSQWHPGVAKHSSDRTSARHPCPEASQRHPRVAKRSSIRSSARRPCPQVPRWHPRVAKGVFWPVFSTESRPTDASMGSSRCHCELVHRIVAFLGFVKFTWNEPLLIIK